MNLIFLRFFRIGILAILSFDCSIAQGQAPKVIPPSPNAFAFQKYGDIPVSTYTGVPTISIPVYVVKSGDISVPIDISYHASGIKVTDEASKVGLGWVINAGGMVSRSIVGVDDFTWGADFLEYHNAELPELLQNPPVDFGRSFNIEEGCAPMSFPTIGNIIDYDGEPDQYFFSLPSGKSGKFILKRNKEVILAKEELIDIKITATDYNVSQWRIRTPDGFVYEFDMYERYLDDRFHNIAWYLTKIISPTNNSISFKYSSSTSYVTTTGAFTETREDGAFSMGYESCAAGSYYGAWAPGRQYTNVQLDSIVFKEGFVKFQYSGREDLLNDKKLDKIEVYRRQSINPTTYERVKGTEFLYEYFQGESDQVNGTPSSYQSKRLKLKHIYDKSKNDENGAHYLFEYHNESDAISLLPSKLSFARDHWGYYNGRDGNTSLIPVFQISNSPDLVRRSIGTMGPQRNPDPSTMTLFALKKIQYPTGGHTEFEFGANDFDLENSIINDNSYFNNDDDEVINTSIGVGYSNSDTRHYSIPGFPVNFTDAQQNNKVLDFSNAYLAPNATTFTADLSIFFRFSTNLPSCPSGNETVTIELISENGTVISYSNVFQSIGSYGKCVGVQTGDPQHDDPPYSGIDYKRSYTLTPGKYFLRYYIQPGVDFIVDAGATFTYLIPVTAGSGSVNGNKFVTGGGLRVNRILTFDSQSSAPQITRYDYHFIADINNDNIPEEYSYGRRMVRPNYSYFERSSQGGNPNPTFCEILKRGSESLTPLNSNGSPVAYDQVTVYNGQNGENGKTLFEYNNVPDVILDYSQVTSFNSTSQLVPRRPPAMCSISDRLNGTQKKQIDFKYTGLNEFDTVRVITNNYADDYLMQYATIWAIETRRDPTTGVLNCTGEDGERVVFYVYPSLTRSRVNLEETIEESFDQTDQTKKVTKTTQNTYSNSHFQLSQQNEYLNGKQLITKLKYPMDYADAECTPALLAMKNRQSIYYTPVIQKRTEELVGTSESVIGQDVTKYDYIDGTSFIVPKDQASFLLSKPEPVANVPDFVPVTGITNQYNINFQLVYNADCNIETIKRPNDIPLSYIWGYQDELPIAEVKNALSTQVLYTSFEDFGEGVATNFKTGKYSYQMSTGNIIRNLESGKYRLQYWAKGTINLAGGGNIVALSTSVADANGWVLYEKELTVTTATTLTLSGTSSAYIDELRLYPLNSQLTTYTYDPLIGMTSITDANNITTNYEYDDFGRFKLLRDHEGNILKQYEYNYQMR